MSTALLLAIIILAAEAPGPAQDAPSPEAGPPGGKDLHQLFTESNRLFNGARSEEALRQAVEGYQAILDRGVRNGRIFYNLGCAWLRLRDLGPAILSLQRALRYLSEDPKTLATLAYARKQVADEFPRPEASKALRTLFIWHESTSFESRLWTALAASAGFWALLALGAFRRIPFHRTAMGALLLLAAAAGGSAAVEAFGQEGVEAVVVLKDVEVRSGNGTGFPLLFAKPIHSGVEVRLLETRGTWRQVEFPNGIRGWVAAPSVEPVDPAAGG